ncbi:MULTISPECIES: UDP-2,3-diacylglucosamine diphosphatase [Methylobacillus]|uniref:UDP-2,3-diacylglucosamine hydrolase n=1 Tax=Methylobacillus flagellatus (strain ATCC 51484 / DSM 6875 / VKM B-1610 / KT) TaxID=265072 RepID=Q1H422_METFK|nr:MULTISPECIES: UDP-2,3-diacylglucosamine diphosphatase [Methylobacillus]ABE48765.1 UDP-2,3-diacylglucosamine hydrolase [Methylobacillus flagellatus KT]MPS49415.1 UDP-2,3-diacylglucosamine diphosphatase [Methylobacillus sp.]
MESADQDKTAFSLLISDLHLCDSRPAITAQFLDFLHRQATQARALYILGDFFEYWAGDDDLAHYQPIIQALRALSDHGTQLYFMHGNRDFLIGEAFAYAAGLKLLPDPSLLILHGKRALLSHGDALCTDDAAYQAFRRQVRHPTWQQEFLQQPLDMRKAQIAALRQRSEQEKSGKQESIMDVNPEAVAALLREYDYPELLIHGHTHRPALHPLEVDGHRIDRWVLGDWYEQGSYLLIDQQGIHSQPLP